MLEADEGDATTFNHELTGVRGSDTDHEYDIDIGVVVEESATRLFRGPCERHHISALDHRPQVGSIGQRSQLHYGSELGTVRVENVVVPVRFQKSPMSLEVAVVGCDAISAIQYGKKVR